jgi:hypothetical protein
MYFQINKLIPATYLFITYYPFIELFCSRTKVNRLNTMLLSLLPLSLDNLDLIISYIIFVPCEFFILLCTK